MADADLGPELSLVDVVQLEMEADYQVQVQAKNAHDWGKVSEQFSFRTSTAGTLVVVTLSENFWIFQCNCKEFMGLYFGYNIPDVVALLLNV